MQRKLKPSSLMLFVSISIIGLLLLTGCDSGDCCGDIPPEPAAPTPSFSYSVSGAAIKGAVSGGAMSLVDSAGVSIEASATTGSDGQFQLTFTSTTTLEALGGAALSDADMQTITGWIEGGANP